MSESSPPAHEPRRQARERKKPDAKAQSKPRPTDRRPFLQLAARCTCGGSGGACEECQRKRQLQLRANSGPHRDSLETEADRAASRAGSGLAVGAIDAATTVPALLFQEADSQLIAADDAPELRPGQLRRADFLEQARTRICAAADAAMAETDQTTEGCPYVERWLSYYSGRDPADIERAIVRYAPEAAGAASAAAYIEAVADRVADGVRRWATTGQVTGLPADVSRAELGLGAAVDRPGEAARDGAAGTAASGPGSAARTDGPAVSPVLFERRPGATSKTADPEAVRASLGAGHSLEAGVRGRMERAFGSSFDGVRVHTDSRAGSLADSLGARAFTVGSDVAFAGGEYRPGSLAGDALIAHELAHTIQQRGGTTAADALESDADSAAFDALATGRAVVSGGSGLGLQRCATTRPRLVAPPPPDRVPPEYRVLGRIRAPGDTDDLFFDRNDATLFPDQQLKIPTIISSRPAGTALTLNGFRSEDEPPALAAARIAAVESALAGAVPPAGPRTPNPLPLPGQGRLEYRQMRKVEVLTTGVVSAEPNCAVAPKTFPCPPTYETAFTAARTLGVAWINTARTRLVSPRSAATNSWLTRYFASASDATATTVAANLLLIRNQITTLVPPARHQCGNQCDGICASGTIAYNHGSGAAAIMTMCIGYDARDPDDSARNMIHEAAHGTVGLTGARPTGTRDEAYRHERRLDFLTTAVALNNSDSYSLLVMRLNGAVPSEQPPVDTPVGLSPPEFETARHAVALLEKWVTSGSQAVKGVYETIKTSKPPAGAWTNTAYETRMGVLAARLTGLTAPPALPSDDDQMRVAGIADRVQKLVRAVKRPLNLQKTGAPLTWELGPGTDVTVTAAFVAPAFGTHEDRALVLLEQLIAALPDIPSGQRAGYRNIINDLRLLP